MRILILGASGLIASALATRLESEGHDVGRASRQSPSDVQYNSLQLDLAALPNDSTLDQHLSNWDVLINAVGIGPGFSASLQKAIHFDGPCRIFDRAIRCGIPHIVQISAQGHDEKVPFLQYKHAADDYLLQQPGNHCVVRPSLVFSPDGVSSKILMNLAQSPILALPESGNMPVQPIHIDDLVTLLVKLIIQPVHYDVIEAGGPRLLSFGDYLRCLSRKNKNDMKIFSLPMPLATIAMKFQQWRNPALGGSDALRLLCAGSSTPNSSIESIIGQPLRDPGIFVSPELSQNIGMQQKLAWVVCLGRLSVALVCFASGLISLIWPEYAKPYEKLARLGVNGWLAQLMFHAMVLMDVVCGWLVLVSSRPLMWWLQGAVVVGYTIVLSIYMPELWGEPFGPLLKNITLLSWIMSLALSTQKDAS